MENNIEKGKVRRKRHNRDCAFRNWIIKSLEFFKLSPIIVNVLKSSRPNWKTTLFYHINLSGNIKYDSVDIKRGIFQRHSFSPLLFFLAVIPLATELNGTGYGYKIGDKILIIWFTWVI